MWFWVFTTAVASSTIKDVAFRNYYMKMRNFNFSSVFDVSKVYFTSCTTFDKIDMHFHISEWLILLTLYTGGNAF